MKINTSSNQKKNTITILLLVLFVLAAIFILEKTRITDFIKDPTYRETSQGPTEEEVRRQEEVQAEQKAEFLDKNTKTEDAKPAEVPTEPETIELSAEQEGETVTVHNKLHGHGYSSGTCKLTVTNKTKTVSQVAQIMYQPEYSICAGFSVPVSSVDSGNWTILLEVTPFNGQTISQSTTVEVKP